MVEDFEKTCRAMGGEYTEENGLIEPDVGFDTFSEKEVKKQWCSLGHLESAPEDLNIFKVPGEVEIQSELFKPTEGIRFNFFKVKYDKQKMCFKSTIPEFSDDVPGISNICISTYPDGQPTAVWIGFPEWEGKKHKD